MAPQEKLNEVRWAEMERHARVATRADSDRQRVTGGRGEQEVEEVVRGEEGGIEAMLTRGGVVRCDESCVRREV